MGIGFACGTSDVTFHGSEKKTRLSSTLLREKTAMPSTSMSGVSNGIRFPTCRLHASYRSIVVAAQQSEAWSWEAEMLRAIRQDITVQHLDADFMEEARCREERPDPSQAEPSRAPRIAKQPSWIWVDLSESNWTLVDVHAQEPFQK